MALSLIPLLTTKLTVTPVTDAKGSRLDRVYKRSLQGVMNWPKLSALAAVLVLASIVVPKNLIGSANEDGGDNGRLFLNYHIQGNYSLEEVRDEVSQMEAYRLPWKIESPHTLRTQVTTNIKR